MDFFDSLDETNQRSKNEEPFFMMPYASEDEAAEKKTLQWLTNERNFLLQANRERFALARKNLALRKGIQYKDQTTRTDEREEASSRKKAVQKIVINKLKEADETRASKLLKYKPAVQILPTNDELSDKIAAEMTTNLKDHIWYTQRFDGEVLPEVVRLKGPTGESYLFVEWDPNLGDKHESYKQAEKYAKEKKMQKVPILDDNGKPMLAEDGKEIYIKRVLKNGDVGYNVKSLFDVLIDRHPSKKMKNARYCFKRELMNVYEARAKWPDKAKFIKGNKDTQFFDIERMETYTDPNLVEVWYFYYKRDEFMEDGRYVVFTTDGILSNSEFPYTHTRLPFIPWTDKKNPEEMHGVSFFEDCKGAFGAFNNLTNMILRNEILVGMPKWMMPQGAANIQELGNATTVVQFKGPTPPQLVQANPTGQGAYQLREALKEEGMQAAAVSRVGNGEPPQGITAAVALQYLSELENERWNEDVLSHNENILQTVIMTIAVAADYYDPSDKRMIRIQGQDGEWQSLYFDATNLSKDYDIRIQGSSALPESKAARTETLLFLAEKFPDRVDNEQILEMFDLAQNKKFIKEGTISLRAAEAENEQLVKGMKMPTPQQYEDQVVHWLSHVKQIREWSFKNRTPKEKQTEFFDHIMAHEFFMLEMASKSPALAQKIAALEGFPLFYKPDENPDDQGLGEAEVKEEQMAAMASAQMAAGGQPMLTDVGDGTPMDVPPEQVVQEPGAPTQEPLPPIDQQLGLEQTNLEPTNGI